MRKEFSWFSGMMLMLSAATCQTPQGQTMIKVISQQDDAQIKVGTEGERAFIQIFSASGIGQAGFELTSRKLPRRLVMRFYLRGLEELRFAYGETVVTASLSSSGEPEIRQRVSKAGERPVEAQTIAADSRYWMKLRVVSQSKIPLQDGYIEIEAPEDFLQSGIRQASIRWIDFYR
jgi:hypothetical protein